MPIPLVDLQAQYSAIKHEILPALERVLDGMHLFLGPEVAAFERDFAAYTHTSHGVGCGSGTDALVLALRACGIGAGDEVITVANTFIATVEAISAVGAVPVFVDIDPATFTLDPGELGRAYTPRTRAIIPVHLFGQACDMDPILEFARAHDLRVIEDASQAHGATYKGQAVGGLGDVGAFSLYYSKNLGAYGEAGICVTNNDDYAATMRMLRDHGSRVRYHHDLMGLNSRLDEMQAAILNVKLPYLESWIDARRTHAALYTALLGDAPVVLPAEAAWGRHVYYVYVIRVEERDRLRAALEHEGILTGIHYPLPLHLQPACAQYGYARGMFPVTEAAAEHILSLPMYAELTDEQVRRVADAVARHAEVHPVAAGSAHR